MGYHVLCFLHTKPPTHLGFTCSGKIYFIHECQFSLVQVLATLIVEELAVVALQDLTVYACGL